MMISSVDEAVDILKQGELLIFPTDTVYGLGCDASSEEAVQQVFDITNRPLGKWLIILCSSLEMIERYAEIRSEAEKTIIEEAMPGSVTLILDSKHELPSLLEQANGTIGVRIPDHDLALSIIEWLDCPLATKSANLSGLLPPTDVDEIDEFFVEQWVAILDGGEVDVQVPSTIVRISEEWHLQILREGAVSEEELRDLIE